MPDCPLGNICNIEYWSGFDESRKQNGEGAGFPFRLKWGQPTEISIPMFDAVSTLKKKLGQLKRRKIRQSKKNEVGASNWDIHPPDSYVWCSRKTKREKEDKSKKKTFRLKWGHLTEIFIREHGFLVLMHSTKEGQNHTKW